MQVFTEELAAHALKKFEYEFKNPEKNIMTLDDTVYCVHVIRWDYWIESALLLREAMLKMRVEDKNPCKFNWGPSSSNMARTIQKYLTETCVSSFLKWRPKDNIRDVRSSNCYPFSHEHAKKSLETFGSDGMLDEKAKKDFRND